MTYDKLGHVELSGPIADSNNIDEVIESDKRYGIMVPRNGKYFTFRIIDTQDNEVTEKMLNQAVKLAWKSWTLRLNFDVRQARHAEPSDFTVLFRTPENDERNEMNPNTIMYHYFPISDVSNPLRGLCVINPNYYFTSHGNGIPLHIIDPEHYPEPTEYTGSTIDLDAVLRHEFGHGIGLPHDPIPNSTMSTPYHTLNEFLAERDIARGVAKYGKNAISERRLRRWLDWLFGKSER